LIKHAVDSGSLLPSTSYNGVKEAEAVFSCVGTPDNPDGSSNLEHVYTAAKTASKLLRKGAVYVQKSTVPVGTGVKVQKLLPGNVHYVSNPEFLREGTAVFDTLFFDRVVVGGSNDASLEKVLNIYRTIEDHRDAISKRAEIESIADDGIYIKSSLESAELTKVTANAFLALKISFANSIAKLADESGANVVDVMDAVGADKRIGRAFLNAGRGYGGGCFPKDVSGLISSASEHGVDMPIMVSAVDVNESMPGYIAEKAKKHLGTLKDKRVAVLGLAFKAGTSDARRSPGVKLANILDKAGANVHTFDPHANGEAKEELRGTIKIEKTLDATTINTDAVFLTTEWQEFADITLDELVKNMSGNLIVDGVNIIDPRLAKSAGLDYLGVGRS